MNKQAVIKLIRLVIADMTLSDNIVVEEDTPLIGISSQFDSMDLVMMTAMVEQELEGQGHDISIMSDKAFSLKNSPFRTVGTLAEYIESEINA